MTWKITIAPTKTGVRVRTQCPLGHRMAEELSRLIEQVLAARSK